MVLNNGHPRISSDRLTNRSGTSSTLPPLSEDNTSPAATPADSSSGTTTKSARVRVTFYESNRPLVVTTPDPFDDYFLNAAMTETATNGHHVSNESGGWDNPFRPDGDLSREADDFVEALRSGKPVAEALLSPTSTTTPSPSPTSFSTTGQSKTGADYNVTPSKAYQNDAAPKSGTNGTAATPGAVVLQHGVVNAGDASDVEHVVLKKKEPKCRCCVIQ